jgi:hypothetical protein
VRELRAASAAVAAPRSAFGFMKSNWPLWLVWSLVGGKNGVASNTVNPTGVREPVRYLGTLAVRDVQGRCVEPPRGVRLVCFVCTPCTAMYMYHGIYPYSSTQQPWLAEQSNFHICQISHLRSQSRLDQARQQIV